MEVVAYIQPQIERDIQDHHYLNPGVYYLVPKTLGGLLQRPKNGRNPEMWKVQKGDETFYHPDYETTIEDIFRKLDLILNRVLDNRELNILGDISGLISFRAVVKSDFNKQVGKFKDFSCTNDGLTLFGFK